MLIKYRILKYFSTTDIISSIVSDPFELGNISQHALNDILVVTKPLAAQ